MADSVTSQVLFSGDKRYAAMFTNSSDGTGESAVIKVDISTLIGAPSRVKIARAVGNTFGMAVAVLFDHTTDDRVLILNDEFDIDFKKYGGLQDPGSAGGTGDILFTTIGASSGDTYNILLELELS